MTMHAKTLDKRVRQMMFKDKMAAVKGRPRQQQLAQERNATANNMQVKNAMDNSMKQHQETISIGKLKGKINRLKNR